MGGDANHRRAPGQLGTGVAAGLTVAGANFDGVSDETRIERRLDRLIEHAVNPRKAAVVIATVTTAITLLAGWLMTVIDHTGFPTLGSGMWWAVQTVTTVGYGDHVPTTDAGQLMAAATMLLGIGFITVITASITGAFVARSRREQHLEGPEPARVEDLQEVIERLERIEAALTAKA
jgi:voltage-gated potassium channel